MSDVQLASLIGLRLRVISYLHQLTPERSLSNSGNRIQEQRDSLLQIQMVGCSGLRVKQTIPYIYGQTNKNYEARYKAA